MVESMRISFPLEPHNFIFKGLENCFYFSYVNQNDEPFEKLYYAAQKVSQSHKVGCPKAFSVKSIFGMFFATHATLFKYTYMWRNSFSKYMM